MKYLKNLILLYVTTESCRMKSEYRNQVLTDI